MEFSIETPQKSDVLNISNFYGLNRMQTTVSGEMSDMRNMSSYEFPCASPRRGRQKVCDLPENAKAITANDSSDTVSGFTGVAANAFYYNGETVSGAFTLPQDFDWEITRLGRLYVINGYNRAAQASLMYYYNRDTDTFGECFTSMNNLIVTSGSDSEGSFLSTFRCGFDDVMQYSVTTKDGTVINNSDFFSDYASGAYLPQDNIFEKVFEVGDDITILGFPTLSENVGQVWSRSGSGGVIPQTNQDFSINNTVDPDLYADLSLIDKYSPVSAVVTGFKVTTQSISGRIVYIHHLYYELRNRNGDVITAPNMYNNSNTFYCSGVTVSKRRRVFDHICAHHNRIWGTSPLGTMVFASASDKLFSFTAADISGKFAARITNNAPGRFTGICSYGGELLLFKETGISAVYGTNPTNYTAVELSGVGCIDSRSVAVTSSGVIFLAHSGFYLYGGNTPQLISEKLGHGYTHAVSGYDGERYYASAYRGDVCEFLVCDLRRRIWHIEDDFSALGLFSLGGTLYIADNAALYRVGADEEFSWSFTTALSSLSTLDSKYVNELWIHARLYDGAEIAVSTVHDNGSEYNHCRFSESGEHLFRCSVRPHECLRMGVKISGRGRAVIYAVEIKSVRGGRRHKEFTVNGGIA